MEQKHLMNFTASHADGILTLTFNVETAGKSNLRKTSYQLECDATTFEALAKTNFEKQLISDDELRTPIDVANHLTATIARLEGKEEPRESSLDLIQFLNFHGIHTPVNVFDVNDEATQNCIMDFYTRCVVLSFVFDIRIAHRCVVLNEGTNVADFVGFMKLSKEDFLAGVSFTMFHGQETRLMMLLPYGAKQEVIRLVPDSPLQKKAVELRGDGTKILLKDLFAEKGFFYEKLHRKGKTYTLEAKTEGEVGFCVEQKIKAVVPHGAPTDEQDKQTDNLLWILLQGEEFVWRQLDLPRFRFAKH